MLVLLVEIELFGKLAHLPVDSGPAEAIGEQLLKHPAVLALTPAHKRSQDAEAGVGRQFQHLVDDLLDRLAGDRAAALRAVRMTDARVQQAQVVIDLSDGADRRTRVARGRPLVDGDGRRQALYAVDVGLIHLTEELAGVGRQRFDIAALTLSVDGVEGQGALARPAKPGDDDEAIARQAQGHVLEVVLAGSRDDYLSGAVAVL